MSEENRKCAECRKIIESHVKGQKELAKVKREHENNRNNFLGYKNSEEAKKKEEDIKVLEKNIEVKEKQLPEFTCLKNSTCGKDGTAYTKNCSK
ncbi:10485_t:CDS:2, partial [Funneliformis geosporum]